MVTAVADVRDPAGLRRRATGSAELGRLDIVVANAGICTIQRWDEVTPEVWDAVIGVNLTGVWNTCVAAAPHLIAAGGGSMILISSTAGLKGQPFLAPYAASKHGVVGVMRVLANELAAHADPGQLRPPHRRGHADGWPAWSGLAERIADRPDARADLHELAARRRASRPGDVSDAVLFLASDEAALRDRADHDRRRRGVGPMSAGVRRYRHLFTPLRLGPLTVPNRIVFSAHLTNYAERRDAHRAARRLLRGPGGRAVPA